MNNLEFRYFDSVGKFFQYSSQFDWPDNFSKLEKFFSMASRYANGVVQQYTGLTDSTGKKIFEGDIVSTVYEEYSIAEVFFCVEMASWRLSSKKTVLPLITLRTQEGQHPKLTNVFEKVIGNIFETPELLK